MQQIPEQPTHREETIQQTPEQIARQLIAQLNRELSQHEDAETAIAAYKTANWIINQLEEVKKTAIDLAEHDMQERGLEALRTPAGSAGWTKPEARQLNQQAWQDAIARNPELARLQWEYDRAYELLERAREPYMELPAPWFFIR